MKNEGNGWKSFFFTFNPSKSCYFRLRGTNLPPNTPNETDAQGNPLSDTLAKNITYNDPKLGPNTALDADVAAWSDLWFYSNPIFIKVGNRNLACNETGIKKQVYAVASGHANTLSRGNWRGRRAVPFSFNYNLGAGRVAAFLQSPLRRREIHRSMEQKKFQITALYVLLFLSGFAGLGYEIVWTRLFAVGLGHEIPAVLAVVAAFFSGLALGAWSLDRRVSTSRVPGRWYASLEMLIGVWAVVLVFLIPSGNFLAARLMGVSPSPLRHWTVAFLVPFFLLLPATVAMGATLPAAERLFSRLRQDGWSVGGLYAANTLGAVAGTMLTTLVIAPALGFKATLYSLAALNLLCGVGILAGPARREEERLPVNIAIPGTPVPARLSLVLFFTGLLGIGYEVLVVRVLSQVLENTIYSFAGVLSVYLFGTACGAALYQKFAPRERYRQVLASLLIALSTACFLGIVLLWGAPFIYRGVREGLGGGMGGSVLGEVALALVVFFLPTVFMGATFSHLAQGARRPEEGLGRALGVNTLGSALAPAFFGVLCLPALGAKTTLMFLASGYLVSGPALAAGQAVVRRASPGPGSLPAFHP